MITQEKLFLTSNVLPVHMVVDVRRSIACASLYLSRVICCIQKRSPDQPKPQISDAICSLCVNRNEDSAYVSIKY